MLLRSSWGIETTLLNDPPTPLLGHLTLESLTHPLVTQIAYFEGERMFFLNQILSSKPQNLK